MDSDSRRMPRRSVSDPVEVTDTMTGEVVGQLANLSVGGMLLITAAHLVEDAIYQLRFDLPDRNGHPIEVGAHLLWRADAGAPGKNWAGMQFLGLSPEATVRLRDWSERDASPS